MMYSRSFWATQPNPASKGNRQKQITGEMINIGIQEGKVPDRDKGRKTQAQAL
jgi:hypothetical protein